MGLAMVDLRDSTRATGSTDFALVIDEILDFLLNPLKSDFFLLGSATSTCSSSSVLPRRELALPRLDPASLPAVAEETLDRREVTLPRLDSLPSVNKLDRRLELAGNDQSANEPTDPRGEIQETTSSYSGSGPNAYSGAASTTDATRVCDVRSKTVSEVGGRRDGIWKVKSSLIDQPTIPSTSRSLNKAGDSPGAALLDPCIIVRHFALEPGEHIAFGPVASFLQFSRNLPNDADRTDPDFSVGRDDDFSSHGGVVRRDWGVVVAVARGGLDRRGEEKDARVVEGDVDLDHRGYEYRSAC